MSGVVERSASVYNTSSKCVKIAAANTTQLQLKNKNVHLAATLHHRDSKRNKSSKNINHIIHISVPSIHTNGALDRVRNETYIEEPETA